MAAGLREASPPALFFHPRGIWGVEQTQGNLPKVGIIGPPGSSCRQLEPLSTQHGFAFAGDGGENTEHDFFFP